jgi:hypothetical protein
VNNSEIGIVHKQQLYEVPIPSLKYLQLKSKRVIVRTSVALRTAKGLAELWGMYLQSASPGVSAELSLILIDDSFAAS